MNRSDATLAVQELLFRWFFERPDATPRHCFLSLGADDSGRVIDPPPELMERLKNVAPAAKPASATVPDAFRVVDRATGEYGSRYTVRIERWVSDVEVVATHESYTGPLSSFERTVRVRFDAGRWQFAGVLSVAIS